MKRLTALLAAGALVACRASAHAQCPGDLVPDGRVDGLDLGVMLAYWGPTTALELSLAADLNQDTVVDGADLGILLSRWGFCRPVVTSVSPMSGCYLGGTTITVTGSLLAQVSAVTVGGVPCTGVVPLSSTSVRAITPPGTIGPAAVQVTTPGGTATAPSAFAYATSEVTGISPVAGPPSGGTPVVITGRLLTGTTAVTFGGVPATDVVNVSETQVRAVTPAGQLGPVDVALTGPKGTATLAGGFTYQEAPPSIDVDMAGWQTWGGIAASGNSSTIIDVPAGPWGVNAVAYASLSYEALGNS
ncbi:MAG: IPT/TIG domain-containing protein, partial [Phycisphaerales bacterium]